MISSENFLINLNKVRTRIKNACDRSGRDFEEVELMAVSKTHPAECVDLALEAGLRRIGENRVQEAAAKRPATRNQSGIWELIGPLQSNKARLAVETVDRIQTVDRIKLVNRLEHMCKELRKAAYPVLMQVNVSLDPAKHGCLPEQAPALFQAILDAPHLRIEGLMTIGEFTRNEKQARETFQRLRELRDELRQQTGASLPVLSMGMTDDLEWAIVEGSTLIRVGTALFGERDNS